MATQNFEKIALVPTKPRHQYLYIQLQVTTNTIKYV